MDNIKWIFDGIGTLIIGLLLGSGVGYKVGIKRSIKQSQKAGNNSNQTQIGDINDDR